eukprot:m.359161 g.359161  ORF g.359161 m.359161 type:complete len:135 (-) comp18456_c0_seq1:533-937(-)
MSCAPSSPHISQGCRGLLSYPASRYMRGKSIAVLVWRRCLRFEGGFATVAWRCISRESILHGGMHTLRCVYVANAVAAVIVLRCTPFHSIFYLCVFRTTSCRVLLPVLFAHLVFFFSSSYSFSVHRLVCSWIAL